MTASNRWRAIANHLADAQVASRIMLNEELPAQVRARATRGYVRAADALVEELGALRSVGAFAAIQTFLDERYRNSEG